MCGEINKKWMTDEMIAEWEAEFADTQMGAIGEPQRRQTIEPVTEPAGEPIPEQAPETVPAEQEPVPA